MTDRTTPPLRRVLPRGALNVSRFEAGVFWSGCGMLVLALAVLCNWLPYVPPLQDYGDWTYQGYLIKRILVGDGSTLAYLKSWPVPNSIAQVGLAALNLAFLPISASKIFISAYLVFAGLALGRITRPHRDPRGALNFLLLVGLVIVPGPYWVGEINYQIGLCILLFYIFAVAKDRAPGIGTTCAYAILLFFCHALCLGVFLIYVGFRALSTRRILQTGIAVLPASLLVVWYLLVNHRNPCETAGLMPKVSGLAEAVAYRFYEFAKIGPYQNPLFDGSGDFERARLFYYSGIAVNFLFALVIGLLFISWTVQSLRTRRYTAEFMTALACVALAITNPIAQLGVGNLSERLFYPAVGIAIIAYNGGYSIRKAGAVLSTFLLVYLVHLIVIMPAGIPSRGGVEDAAVNQPERRYHLLFWHRPFLNVAQAEAAQRSASSGIPPTHPIAFGTSLLEPTETMHCNASTVRAAMLALMQNTEASR